MGLFDALRVSASGLAAERLRLDVIAGNLANANSTSGPDGQPFRKRMVLLQEASAESGAAAGGVRVAAIVDDTSPLRRVHDPSHPEADEQGYVTLPNVNPVSEMVDMIGASRAYEANVTAMKAAKDMALKTLDLLR